MKKHSKGTDISLRIGTHRLIAKEFKTEADIALFLIDSKRLDAMKRLYPATKYVLYLEIRDRRIIAISK